MRNSKLHLLSCIILLSTVFIGCAITPANINKKTPRQEFSISSNNSNELVPHIVGIIENNYPFKYYQTTVVSNDNFTTVRSYDNMRGYVLWIILSEDTGSTNVKIYMSPDMYWNADEIAKNLRKTIEKLEI